MRLIKILLDLPNRYLIFGEVSYFVLLLISFVFVVFALFGPKLPRDFGKMYVFVMTLFLAISITSIIIGNKKLHKSKTKK